MCVTPPSPSRIRVRSSSDLIGVEALEEAASCAEEDGNHVQLDLVERTGCEREPRHTGTVHQHVPSARGLLRLGHRGRDVGLVADQRPLSGHAVGVATGEDEDRDAVVVVATQPPAGSKVPRPATTAPVDMNSS